METETALIGADSTVELNTVAGVGADFACIVNPGDAECEDAVRLYQTLNYLCLFKFGMLVVYILDGLENLLYGLQILFLQRVFGLEACHDIGCFHSKRNNNWL